MKITFEDYKKLGDVLTDYVNVDGAHHKQWALEEVAKILDIDLPEHEEGMPD